MGSGPVGVGHGRRAAVGEAVIVEPVSVEPTGDGTVSRSSLLRWDERELRLTIEGPADALDPSADTSAAVVAALVFALRHQPDLVVEGPVDAALAANLEEIQAAYLAWDLQATPVSVAARSITPVRAARHRDLRRAAFFSRGVDSVFTAARDRAGARTLDALVFVDGLEPRHDDEVGAAEIRLATETAAQLELPLVVVRTNVRDLFDPAGFDWEDAVGAGLASVAVALARPERGRQHRGHRGFDEVVIPSGDSWETVEPCGTSPLLDPLFSTSRVRVVHDSIAHTRLGKIGWLVANRPDLLAGLKVCFKENRPDNCGTCGKCLLTMAALQVHGALDQATGFPDTVDPDAIRGFRLPHLKARFDWAEVARALPETGPGSEIRAAAIDTLRSSVLTGADQRDQRGRPVWAGAWWLRNTRLNQTLALVLDGEPHPPLDDPSPDPS